MGVGLGQAIAAAVAEPDRPVIHLSGDSEIETLVRYQLPGQEPVPAKAGDRGVEQWRHRGPSAHGLDPWAGLPEIPEKPDVQHQTQLADLRRPLRPDDGSPRAFAGAGPGGKGFFVEDPKDLKGALKEAMNFRGPALVNVVISQGAARKPQAFRWRA